MIPTPPMPRGGEQFGAWFDAEAAQIAVDFFPTYLCHTEAEWWGRPFVLSPWQADIIAAAFGWKRADGTRLIRQIYLEVPRKNGKTEFAAGIALLLLVADGEMGAQVYSMAVDKDQASIVFNKAAQMVALNEGLARAVETYKTSLYVPELVGSFKPLSARPGSKHGFSPSGAVADEIHEWPTGEVHDVVHKGTAARRQPLEVLITTAGQPGEGYGWEMHEYALAVLAGDVTDPTFLAVIFAADPTEDWTSPETWQKANPNFGISVKPDFLAAEVAKARGKIDRESDFKRFHLNLWNAQKAGGLDMAQWDACRVRPVTLESLAGREVWGGLDLSSTEDLTALCLVAHAIDGPGIDVWWRFWLPRGTAPDALAERVKRDRVPYDRWIEEGLVIATEGDAVDYDAVRAAITGEVLHESHPGPPIIEIAVLKELAIDRWNAMQIATQLQGDGVAVKLFGQGMQSMAAPTKEFLRLLKAGDMNHGGNKVARWMAQNTELLHDGHDNHKPVKPDRRRSPKRIDGIVAEIMAIGVAASAPAPTGSIYDSVGEWGDAPAEAPAEPEAEEVAMDEAAPALSAVIAERYGYAA